MAEHSGPLGLEGALRTGDLVSSAQQKVSEPPAAFEGHGSSLGVLLEEGVQQPRVGERL